MESMASEVPEESHGWVFLMQVSYVGIVLCSAVGTWVNGVLLLRQSGYTS